MAVATRKSKPVTAGMPDNALAKQALETIKQIERDAQTKKMAQLESLQNAKKALQERMSELNHQLGQIDKAVEAITGTPAAADREKRPRRNLTEVRDRVTRWMDGHRGEKFSAGDLAREFPELEGVAISIFLKPLVEEGKIKTDSSEGIRRMKYYIEG